MAINISVQYNGGLLPDIIMLTQCYYHKQPIMQIEDRLFDRGWVRSAMVTRKCGNIYFRKYFIAVMKFTSIFVLLLILMVGSRSIHYSSFASHKKSYGPTGSGCSQMSTVRR